MQTARKGGTGGGARGCAVARVLVTALLACVGPFGTVARSEVATVREEATTASPAPGSVDELMHALSAATGVRARFRETRHVALLVEPLESEGMLYFAPPDRLARHTTHPGDARVLVHGQTVAFRDETGERVLDLGTNEVAREIVDNLAVVLRGDLAALHERYEVEFRVGSEPEGWTLHLEPRSRAVRALIEWIRFHGSGGALRGTETLETSGDRTVAVYSDVETDLVFDPAALRRIFTLDARDAAP